DELESQKPLSRGKLLASESILYNQGISPGPARRAYLFGSALAHDALEFLIQRLARANQREPDLHSPPGGRIVSSGACPRSRPREAVADPLQLPTDESDESPDSRSGAPGGS